MTGCKEDSVVVNGSFDPLVILYISAYFTLAGDGISILLVDSEYLLLIENSEIRLLLLVGVATFEAGTDLAGSSITSAGNGSLGISMGGDMNRSDLP